MASSELLASYLQGFANSDQPWPAALAEDASLRWWQTLPIQGGVDAWWPQLVAVLPQLFLPQEDQISSTELYRQTVLQGQPAQTQIQPLEQPDQLRLWIAVHPYGSMPVLATPCRPDFLWIVRALAHRAEPVSIDTGVHAQAISGLIHWGLIREIGPHARARLIVLHDGPYGSVPAAELSIGLDDQAWVEASTALRLEHELTHLATKRVLGEMRLNLLDELIADAMGMLAAMGYFSAEVFQRCLKGRWRTYVGELDEADAAAALALCLARAHELETVLSSHLNVRGDYRELLPWLCRQQLDLPILPPS